MTWRKLNEEKDDRLVEQILALYEEDPAPNPMTRDKGLRTLRRLRAEPLRGVAIGATGEDGLSGYTVLLLVLEQQAGRRSLLHR